MYNKTKTLSYPVSPEVAAFAVVVEGRLVLEGYDQVESWEGIPVSKLMSQLEAKAKRLAAADPGNATELFNKAVILGAFAMMIAEKAARSKETEGGSVVEFPMPPTSTQLVAAEASQNHGNLPQNAKEPRQKRPTARRRESDAPPG